MKSKEEIINDAIKCEMIPNDYNLPEMHCFLALKQLLIMFYNKQISQVNATITKNKILARYEKDNKQYEFETSMFQEHIQHIKDTEEQRIELRKFLSKKEEITEKRLCEIINTCMEIISTVFKEEFEQWNIGI